MKLSIWQQFSSNHSSSFTIMGEFATSNEAHDAANKLRAMLKKIETWYEEHHDEMEEWWSSGAWTEEPSPPEQALAEQYDVEWLGAIDWFANANIEVVLDRYIMINPTQRPETDGKPFDQLINRLGGTSFHEGDIYGDPTGKLIFNLTCTAPDEDIAIDIYDQYFGLNRLIKRNKTHLHFDRWRFNEDPDLLTLIDELQEQECTNIEYTLKQIPIADDFEVYGVDDIEVLIEIMTQSTLDFERRDVAEILRKMHDPRLIEPFIDALQSSDNWLKVIVISALGDMGDKRAIEPLMQLLKGANELTKPLIENALKKLQEST